MDMHYTSCYCQKLIKKLKIEKLFKLCSASLHLFAFSGHISRYYLSQKFIYTKFCLREVVPSNDMTVYARDV